MFISLSRIIRAGWKNFYRHGGLSFVTCFILVMTLFFITWFFLFYQSIQFSIAKIKEGIDISIYFKRDVSENKILEAKIKISEIPEVKEIEYVSKEKKMEEFIQEHKDDSYYMESLKEVVGNPFLGSLNIKTWELNQYETMGKFLENSSFKDLIERIDYRNRKLIIERVNSIVSGINKTIIPFFIILAVVSFLITFITINLTILNQKEEIKIQRLVGASNWFIQGPFFVQGIIIGIIGFLVCLLISLLVYGIWSPKIEVLFFGFNFFNYFIENFWTFFLIQFGAGIGIGIISSGLSMRKYLKI